MSHAPRTYRLLIVDDDEIDRRLYTSLLKWQALSSFEIEQAEDGAAGLAALRERRPDCLLLDYSLPDMSGLEFLEQAMVEGELPCAVVLITGNGNENIAVEAMKHGVQDYLIKGQVNEGKLWRAIGRAVVQAELRQRLAATLRDLTRANHALENEVQNRQQAEAAMRAAKELAEQANRAKTDFVSMVTHELRTPLNSILGYTQLLRIEGDLSFAQERRLNAMIKAGRHLLETIDMVLDIAQIESGDMVLPPQHVVLNNLFEECLELVRPLASEKNLALSLAYSPDAPHHLGADPLRLRQILVNLLGNAIKYTERGLVELRVQSGKMTDGLRIEVADTGVGVSEPARARLFQSFDRLDQSGTIEGSGLGLSITAHIVRLMGGDIGHFANPAGGSVFWIDLPSAEIAGSDARGKKRNPLIASGVQVLLVDDVAMNRDVIAAMLETAGHEVTTANSGEEAITLAQSQIFDVILMDVRMPVMDGLQATHQIRALAQPFCEVPILALTTYVFREQVAQCKEAGMDGHIAKPVELPILLDEIEKAIQAKAERARATHPAKAVPVVAQSLPATPEAATREALPA